MRNLIYIVAVELMIAWLLGFFVFGGGPYFHILLALAIVLTITRISTNNTLTRKE